MHYKEELPRGKIKTGSIGLMPSSRHSSDQSWITDEEVRLVTIACSSVVALLLVEASFPALASSVILLASLVNGLLALFFNVCDNVFLFLQQTFKIIYFTLFSTTPCYFSS
ncbi:hypothetical protein OUZ56_012225 [Daphnia magna]|uniref:Uncharacterized protein n=1 Tax=Daphnia magna TaxID=35525 RepID=A0ABQ9Z2D3_9CRUS|nr:hypothetical protein OUZ56_012225 [Daphnia magna]